MNKNLEDRLSSRDQFIFGVPADFFQPFEPVEKLLPESYEPLASFKENLRSAFIVGSMPFQLTHSSILQQRFNQIHTAARIRSLVNKDENGNYLEKEEELAFAKASAEMSEELREGTIIKRHAENTLKLLDTHLRDTEFRISAGELLRQIVVLCWGALEVVVNDTMRSLLNANPALVRLLTTDKEYKDALFGRDLVEKLEQRSFDLSNSMGDLFCDAVRLDSLEKMRRVVSLVLQNPAVDKQLKDEKLWKLAQQRHLIVHRRGVVDARFRLRTDEKRPVGQSIEFDSDYVESCLTCVRDAGLSLASSVARASPSFSVDKGLDAR